MKKITLFLLITIIGIVLTWTMINTKYGPQIFGIEFFLFAFILGRISGTSREFVNIYEQAKALEKCAMKEKYDFNDIDELRNKIAKQLQSQKISQDEADFLVAKLDKIDLREKSSM